MSERFAQPFAARMQALYAYTIALEQGDAETLARVLQKAEQDAVLERMILELHDASLAEASELVVEDRYVLPERNHANRERIENAMASDIGPMTSSTRDEPIFAKARKRSHLVAVLQTMVAVLVVGALVGSFALLLAHRPGSPGHTGIGPGTQNKGKGFMVVVADSRGMIYGLRSKDGAVLWRYKAGESEVDTMVQQSGAVYVATLPGVNGNDLYKLRLSDGKLLWKRNFPQLSGFSIIVVDGNAIAISGGEGDGSMDVVRTTDGSLLWRYAPNSIWSHPMVAERNNVMYIRINHGMEAFQFDTGKRLWTSGAIAEVDTLIFSGNVMYAVNMLNGFDWVITTLNVQSGKFLKEIHIRSSSQSTLYQHGYSADALYVTKQTVRQEVMHDQTCALRIGDGTEVWCTQEANDVSILYPLLTMNDNIYYMQLTTNNRWQIDALQARTGAPLWHWTHPGGNTVNVTNDVTIVGANGIVFVTSPQGFFALSSSDGHLLWKTLPGFHPPLFALPAVPDQEQMLPS